MQEKTKRIKGGLSMSSLIGPEVNLIIVLY